MQRLFQIVQKIEEWMISSSILVIAVLTIANVFSRTFFGYSLAFAEELTEFLIILVCFVGLSYAAGIGRHIRMTAIYDQFSPAIRQKLMIAIAGTTSLLMFVLAYFAWNYVMLVKSLGTVSPALQFPYYVVYLAAPMGFVMAGIQYALTTVRNITSSDVYLSYQKKDEYEEAVTDAV